MSETTQQAYENLTRLREQYKQRINEKFAEHVRLYDVLQGFELMFYDINKVMGVDMVGDVTVIVQVYPMVEGEVWRVRFIAVDAPNDQTCLGTWDITL